MWTVRAARELLQVADTEGSDIVPAILGIPPGLPAILGIPRGLG